MAKLTPSPEKAPEEDDSESWITTFADMVTLLMAFFVLLMSVSKIDMVLFEEVKSGMAKSIGKKDNPETPIQDLKKEVQQAMEAVQFDENMSIGQDDEGLLIEFASGAFFKPGSAIIVDEAKPAILKIAATLAAPRYSNFQIEVQGHTDDAPIHTAQFPSNWELSAERATSVVRILESLTVETQPEYDADGNLVKQGGVESAIARERFRAVGYADVVPKVPNRRPPTEEQKAAGITVGDPIAINREINRRIVIRLKPSLARAPGGGGFSRPRAPPG